MSRQPGVSHARLLKIKKGRERTQFYAFNPGLQEAHKGLRNIQLEGYGGRGGGLDFCSITVQGAWLSI